MAWLKQLLRDLGHRDLVLYGGWALMAGGLVWWDPARGTALAGAALFCVGVFGIASTEEHR